MGGVQRDCSLKFVGYGSDYKNGGVPLAEAVIIDYHDESFYGHDEPRTNSFNIELNNESIEWVLIELCSKRRQTAANLPCDTKTYIYLENLVIR